MQSLNDDEVREGGVYEHDGYIFTETIFQKNKINISVDILQ